MIALFVASFAFGVWVPAWLFIVALVLALFSRCD